MTYLDTLQGLLSAGILGILLQHALWTSLGFGRGYGKSLREHRERLLLVVLLNLANLWATLVTLDFAMPTIQACRVTVIFSSIVDQGARVVAVAFLLGMATKGFKSRLGAYGLLGVLGVRISLALAHTGLTRPQHAPLCLARNGSLGLSLTLILYDLAVIVGLAVFSLRRGIWQQAWELPSTILNEQKKATVFFHIGYTVWFLASIPLLLGIRVIPLFVRTAVPAIGLYVLITFIGLYEGALIYSPDRSSSDIPPTIPPSLVPSQQTSLSGPLGARDVETASIPQRGQEGPHPMSFHRNVSSNNGSAFSRQGGVWDDIGHVGFGHDHPGQYREFSHALTTNSSTNLVGNNTVQPEPTYPVATGDAGVGVASISITRPGSRYSGDASYTETSVATSHRRSLEECGSTIVSSRSTAATSLGSGSRSSLPPGERFPRMAPTDIIQSALEESALRASTAESGRGLEPFLLSPRPRHPYHGRDVIQSCEFFHWTSRGAPDLRQVREVPSREPSLASIRDHDISSSRENPLSSFETQWVENFKRVSQSGSSIAPSEHQALPRTRTVRRSQSVQLHSLSSLEPASEYQSMIHRPRFKRRGTSGRTLFPLGESPEITPTIKFTSPSSSRTRLSAVRPMMSPTQTSMGLAQSSFASKDDHQMNETGLWSLPLPRQSNNVLGLWTVETRFDRSKPQALLQPSKVPRSAIKRRLPPLEISSAAMWQTPRVSLLRCPGLWNTRIKRKTFLTRDSLRRWSNRTLELIGLATDKESPRLLSTPGKNVASQHGSWNWPNPGDSQVVSSTSPSRRVYRVRLSADDASSSVSDFNLEFDPEGSDVDQEFDESTLWEIASLLKGQEELSDSDEEIDAVTVVGADGFDDLNPVYIGSSIYDSKILSREFSEEPDILGITA